jgi:hypothetical protein
VDAWITACVADERAVENFSVEVIALLVVALLLVAVRVRAVLDDNGSSVGVRAASSRSCARR